MYAPPAMIVQQPQQVYYQPGVVVQPMMQPIMQPVMYVQQPHMTNTVRLNRGVWCDQSALCRPGPETVHVRNAKAG